MRSIAQAAADQHEALAGGSNMLVWQAINSAEDLQLC
jgi:hypothetical protein